MVAKKDPKAMTDAYLRDIILNFVFAGRDKAGLLDENRIKSV